ncbi:siderophore-interacting protein [Conexibacter woesei]|uniref:siderophore-interacting protein n=1 Tax=Conexibacter woesei TaxID=191495 RepID=UPI000324DFF4|nr:siderophore-interacting protein [Conexibacter woesei]
MPSPARAAEARPRGYAARVASRVTVESIVQPVPGFARVTVAGEGLTAYDPVLPADAFKLLLPAPGDDGFDFPQRGADGLPAWPQGARRPILRPYAVRDADPAAGRIVFDVALRPGGAAPLRFAAGDEIGLAGMRHGYAPASGATRHLLVGDRSALPAIAAIVASLPAAARVTAVLEVAAEEERGLLPAHPGLAAEWLVGPASAGAGSPLEQAARTVAVPAAGAHAWIGGEVGVVRALHAHLTAALGLSLAQVHAVPCWERGRTADERDAAMLERYRAAAARGRDVADPDVADAIELGA